jgi:hypothetical protein
VADVDEILDIINANMSDMPYNVYSEIYDAVDGLGVEVEKMQAENDRQRELLRIMHSEMVSCEDNGYVCGGHKFDDRIRELGIDA